MTLSLPRLFSFPLFVPADRPDRYNKALASSADCIIIDLEDAVPPDDKDRARMLLERTIATMEGRLGKIVVRINACGSAWHAEDVDLLRRFQFAGIVIPKVESPASLDAIRTTVGQHVPLIALIESAAGVAAARDIAESSHQLAFGSIDFAADIGCAHSRDALLYARSELVIASRKAGRPPPIDGVTTEIRDEAKIEDDARYASSLGYGGKLLIHPSQVSAARKGMAPTPEEISWAKRIVEASAGKGAILIDGSMVDAPVLARAQSIVLRANIAAKEEA